jgi:hypothetical protein
MAARLGFGRGLSATTNPWSYWLGLLVQMSTQCCGMPRVRVALHCCFRTLPRPVNESSNLFYPHCIVSMIRRLMQPGEHHCDSSAACVTPQNIQSSIPAKWGLLWGLILDSLVTDTGSRTIWSICLIFCQVNYRTLPPAIALLSHARFTASPDARSVSGPRRADA